MVSEDAPEIEAEPPAEGNRPGSANPAEDAAADVSAGSDPVSPAPKPFEEGATVPQREFSQDMAALSAILNDEINSYNGNWSLLLERTDTGEQILIHDEKMVAASIIKLFVYGAVWEAIENGSLSHEECDSLLYPMITISDNDATNRLIDLVGGKDAVNSFIARGGYQNTELNRKMLSGEPVENYTSCGDCAVLLREVMEGTYVSPDCSLSLLDAMIHREAREKIPGGVPSWVTTASKGGELSDVENDVGIVYAPAGPYILCIMSDDVYLGTAIGNIEELSGIIYDYWN